VNEQLSRVIDVHSLHMVDSGVRPAGADIDVTSRITSAPGSGESRNARSSALCLIMPVIEAQCASILVPHDHGYINHERVS
jgi:hypothetical protein